jgi:hypothetical protein
VPINANASFSQIGLGKNGGAINQSSVEMVLNCYIQNQTRLAAAFTLQNGTSRSS